jgi:hypothetical protein
MPCETFAKLTHDLAHVPNSGLVSSIGPGTLVVIDEADMADTLTLASVIELTVGAGCVGAADRRRPSARRHRHWWTAARCRFHPRRNPAQRAGPVRRPRRGEASLSLRDGDRAALVFYLDNDRVHVGDVATCLPVGATA